MHVIQQKNLTFPLTSERGPQKLPVAFLLVMHREPDFVWDTSLYVGMQGTVIVQIVKNM